MSKEGKMKKITGRLMCGAIILAMVLCGAIIFPMAVGAAAAEPVVVTADYTDAFSSLEEAVDAAIAAHQTEIDYEDITELKITGDKTISRSDGGFVRGTLTGVTVLDLSEHTGGYAADAFSYNAALEKAVLRDDDISLPEKIFFGCRSLTTVGPAGTAEGTADLSGLTSLGDAALSGTAIRRAIIGDTVPEELFDACTSLRTVGPDGDTPVGTADLSGVTSLGGWALSGTAIERAIIGDTLTGYIFSGCGNLRTVGPDGDTPTGTADLSGVTSFEGWELAFTAIERAIIGDTLSEWLFNGCESLRTVGPDGDTPVGTADLRGVTFWGTNELEFTAIERAIVGDTLSDFLFSACGNLRTVGPDGDTPVGTADLRGVTSPGEYSLFGIAVERAILADDAVLSYGLLEGCRYLSEINLTEDQTLAPHFIARCAFDFSGGYPLESWDDDDVLDYASGQIPQAFFSLDKNSTTIELGYSHYAPVALFKTADGSSYRELINKAPVWLDPDFELPQPEEEGSIDTAKLGVYNLTYSIPAEMFADTHSLAYTVTVTKRTQVKLPDFAAEESATATSITLPRRRGVEYSLDGQVWQIRNEFVGLTPGREYTVYARYAGDADSLAGEIIIIKVTTPAAGISSPGDTSSVPSPGGSESSDSVPPSMGYAGRTPMGGLLAVVILSGTGLMYIAYRRKEA